MTADIAPRRPKVLFHVQHLLGVGHVFRARRLAEGLSRAGYTVEVVFGGVPLPDMRFAAQRVHFLPPIAAAGADYAVMLQADGEPLGAAYQDMRAKQLLDIFVQSAPDVVVVEQYPFGRRMLKREMRALLGAAWRRSPRPLIVCSLRDILQEGRKPGRAEEAAALVRDRFDFVLVHSDPHLIRLEETFPLAAAIADKLRYTGIVAAGPPAGNAPRERFDVIVSAGGGAFGAGLLLASRAASQLAPPDLTWCIVTGPNLDPAAADELRAGTPANVSVKTFLPELRPALQAARLSISQAGYNTVADAMAAGCRAIFVPYDVSGQTEQLRRARLLERAGRAIALPQSELTPERLADAVRQALEGPAPQTTPNLDGVANSVAFISDALKASRAAR